MAEKVNSAVGYDLANTSMVEGTDGVIIVDAGSCIESARAVVAEHKKIRSKPVVAVIHTHSHPDHINGVKAHTTEDEVQAGGVAIYAPEMLLKTVENQRGHSGQILSLRTTYLFGAVLDARDRKGISRGIGPVTAGGVPALRGLGGKDLSFMRTAIMSMPAQRLAETIGRSIVGREYGDGSFKRAHCLSESR